MENSLFNQPDVRVAGADSLYYVTNQLNLREILNGHFIGSRFSFDNKYYDDLLNIAPGYIPFLTVSMIQDACKTATGKNPGLLRPVILELERASLKGREEHTYSHPDDRKHLLCVAVTRPVPDTEIKAIHFVSAEDMDETRLREWGEIVQPVELYQVSPQLVNLVGNSTGMLEWLSGLPPVSYPAAGDYQLYDRMAGAVALCASRMRFETRAAEELSLLMRPAAQKSLSILPKWVAEGIHPDTFGSGKKAGDEERALFTAALSVLYRHSWETVNRALDVAAEIGKQIEIMKLSKEATLSILNNLERMRGYLRSERDLGSTPAKPGYEVSKALTLFLMRTDYDQLNRWPAYETGATEEVMLTALIFAGAATGFKNINRSYRTPLTDEIISDRVISAMFEIKKQKKVTERTKPVTTADEPQPVIETETPAAGSKHITEFYSSMDTTIPQYSRLAGELCRHMSWNDCVRTQIRISGVPLTIGGAGENITDIRVIGIPEIIYDIDAGLFGKHLAECDPALLAEFERTYFPERN